MKLAMLIGLWMVSSLSMAKEDPLRKAERKSNPEKPVTANTALVELPDDKTGEVKVFKLERAEDVKELDARLKGIDKKDAVEQEKIVKGAIDYAMEHGKLQPNKDDAKASYTYKVNKSLKRDQATSACCWRYGCGFGGCYGGYYGYGYGYGGGYSYIPSYYYGGYCGGYGYGMGYGCYPAWGNYYGTSVTYRTYSGAAFYWG